MPLEYLYVFRGTTIGYEGNYNSQNIPYTCTSTHPVKALWFALECFSKNPDAAAVYIAEIRKLQGIKTEVNVLESEENEIAFNIKPVDFFEYCIGYINVQDLQAILKMNGWNVYKPVRKDNLTRICQETHAISLEEIEKLVKNMRPYLKMP